MFSAVSLQALEPRNISAHLRCLLRYSQPSICWHLASWDSAKSYYWTNMNGLWSCAQWCRDVGSDVWENIVGARSFWPVHTSFFSSFSSADPLACCCNLNFDKRSQLVSPPSTAHLFFSSPHIYFSPGFSGDPEDLLPDIDLKIMPGRGVMYSSPYLAPSFHTNSCWLLERKCRMLPNRLSVIQLYYVLESCTPSSSSKRIR